MSSRNVWQVKFVAGNPLMRGRVLISAGGPQSRSKAMADAGIITDNNPAWRLWVEHIHTSERIFESSAEAIQKRDQIGFTPAQVAYRFYKSDVIKSELEGMNTDQVMAHFFVLVDESPSKKTESYRVVHDGLNLILQTLKLDSACFVDVLKENILFNYSI